MLIKPMYFNQEPVYNFPVWLYETLKDKEITVIQFANMIDLHPNTVRGYLNGTHEPTLFTATLILDALGYSLGVVSHDNK